MVSNPDSSDTAPLVSVCVVTYRHARFVRQCVESILAQVAEFPFEVVIGEDESDDGTREICQELAAKHPDRIRLLLRRRADVVHIDGRPSGAHNFLATLAAARGEFVAYCEGDDYWTDPTKLARQVGYLRENKDCVGCFHEVALVDGEGRELQAEYFKPQAKKIQAKYDRRDCIAHLLSSYASCSLVFRSEAFRDLPLWCVKRPCDFFVDLALTAHGKLGFIDERMGSYRRHNGGIWSGQPRVMQLVELITRYRLLLAEPEFFPVYRDELMAQLKSFECAIACVDDVVAERQRTQKVLHERDQCVAANRLLIAGRDKLMAFVEKQHAIIKSLEKPVPQPTLA